MFLKFLNFNIFGKKVKYDIWVFLKFQNFIKYMLHFLTVWNSGGFMGGTEGPGPSIGLSIN